VQFYWWFIKYLQYS